MSIMRYLAIVLLVSLMACTTPPKDLPDEAKDADGVGGATAKVEVVKWLGTAILQLITNTPINIKVDDINKEKDK